MTKAKAKAKRPTQPTGLGAGGRKLWKTTLDLYELGPGEVRLLEDACREADLVDRLEAEVRKLAGGAGLVTKGSMGQKVAHPLLSELRQHRGTLARLVAALRLPEDPGSSGAGTPEGSRSSAARATAAARWGKRGA